LEYLNALGFVTLSMTVNAQLNPIISRFGYYYCAIALPVVP